MTPAEFKEKFKVGDRIVHANIPSVPLVVTAIGEDYFIAKGKREEMYSILDYWIKVEPEKKPSEEINDKLVGLTLTFTENNKINSGEYANKRINALQNWLDENWPKVVKK